MNGELRNRLVQWEVRHALRGSTFWVMLAIALLAPLAAAALFSSSPAGLVVAEMLVLVTMISLWIVFAVKRLLGENVADDWLLVLTYRDALAARFAAGLRLGALLYLAATLGFVLASGGDLGALVMQVAAAQALLHGLALAAVIVGAADFLLAPVAVVLFVQMLLATLCSLPVALGLAELPALLLGPEPLRPGSLILPGLAIGLSMLALWFGWWRAEDFWAYLRIEQAERQRASLGAVRTVVQAARRQGSTDSRQAASRARAWYRQRGIEPLLAHDLARYPGGWSLRLQPGEGVIVVVIVALGMVALGVYNWIIYRPRETLLFLLYFTWWVAALAVVFRALVSGAQIVVQEKEQGVLPHLVVAAVPLRHLLAHKLGVVLQQALPLLLLLAVLAQLQMEGVGAGHTLAGVTLVAAVAGVVASALAGSRLLATLLGGLLTIAAVAAAMVGCEQLPPAADPLLLQWFALVLVALLLWYGGRWLGERALRAQAAR